MHFATNDITIKLSMRKVKTFFHVLANSLFPFERYYKKILKTGFAFSLKYFITLVIILQIIFGIIFFIKNAFINQSLHKLNSNLLKMLNNYPSDLIIKIKDGQLTTNYNSPFIMWFNLDKFPMPVLAVDEFAYPEKINEYDSYVLLQNNAITIRTPVNNQIKTFPFPQDNEYVITKNRVNTIQNLLFDSLTLRLTMILVAGYIGINVIFLIFFIVSKIIYLALFAAVIFLIIRLIIKNTHIPYQKIIQISFHTNTLPIIFEYIVITSTVRFSFQKGGLFIHKLGILIWLFSIVYGAFLVAGIYEAYHTGKRHIHHHS